MDPLHVRAEMLVECLVMVFQVAGLAGLGISWLAPTRAWGRRGRLMLLVAMIGLGVAGAICGRNESAFGLFAGGTMTVLLIGMLAGGPSHDPAGITGLVDGTEPRLAG